MSRQLAPLSDISNAWSLTGDATAYQCVDDDPQAADDDTTYISTGTDGAQCEIALQLAGNPNEYGTHTVRISRRVRNYDSLNQPTLTIELLCGVTVITTITDIAGGAAYVLLEYVLSRSEVEAITDYNDLRLRFTDTLSPGTQQHRVTAARLEIPERRAKVYGD